MSRDTRRPNPSKVEPKTTKCPHCEREAPTADFLECPECGDFVCDSCIAGKNVRCFTCEENDEA